MIGVGYGGAVVSPVDRASEFTPVQRVDGKRAEAVGGAMTDLPEGPGARVQGPHDHGGQRQGVRGAREGGERAQGRLPLPDAPPLVGAGPERAYRRAAAPVPAEGDRPAAGHGRPREAGPGHPERAPRKALGYLTPAEAFVRVRPP